MEREMSVAELSKYWAVSINTTWKRINKDNLQQVKKSVNNLEITFIIVDDAILNKYEVNNGVINANYEEILSDDNSYKPQNADIVEKLMEYSREFNNQLIELNTVHNQQINTLNNEIINYKSQNLLLEDLSKREKQNMFEIQAENKTLKMVNKRLLIALIITLMLFVLLCTPLIYYLLKHFIH